MTEKVLYEQDGPLVTITLNDPGMRNPISEREMVDGIVDALERLNEDGSVRVAILTGAGTAFSSGGDLRKMQAEGAARAEKPHLTPRYYKFGIQRIPLAFEKLDVPIIAAVNGPAIGAGLDLACMCDMRIASESARFAESFVKVGIVPGDGGAWLLPRVIGMPRATQMTLTGETIDAAKALEYGLVTETLTPEKLMDRARTIAASIAANPGHSTRMAKRLLREGQDMKLGPLLELSAAYQALAHHTAEHEEMIAAFVEKRAPKPF